MDGVEESDEKDERDRRDVRMGRALASQRTKMRMTQQGLAAKVRVSKGLISHFEQGKRRISPGLIGEIDVTLRAERRLTRLYQELYAPDQVDWLGQLAQHQREAELIKEYQRLHVPGNLQTPGYASGVIASGAPWFSPGEVEERVETRMSRAKDLLALQTPHYHVVLDDAVVRRLLVPPKVMAEQCTHLLEMAESGRVMLQVYEWGQYPHPGVDGSFALIAAPEAPEVLHVESVLRGQTSDDPSTVRRYGMLFSRLQAAARTPEASAGLLRNLIKEYSA
ncbi:helix-turn-helix domain-containing protein [Nocardiopsis lambiniae]|uniref:Helix-turn-helix transcriptional regulator n=1 Tax=Nocardiopsis lambiniae TaxID=3075539 RepID=A0ABU2M7I1_9ACTN|nr:helix-turn-helix transcriptional regulator [Nocardiopsis sp. DSM 44743]MDT0328482.1 helix-turn-helix transcriptional regulator [Nocardiopsis sp. DSM 44743]